MNVYRVRRKDCVGYDEFDSFVCVAESEEQALSAMPQHEDDAPLRTRQEDMDVDEYDYHSNHWPAHSDLEVDLIATNAIGPARIVTASFNAG